MTPAQYRYRCDLDDWQRRFDLAANAVERIALMVELEDQLRPDVWERNHDAVL